MGQKNIHIKVKYINMVLDIRNVNIIVLKTMVTQIYIIVNMEILKIHFLKQQI